MKVNHTCTSNFNHSEPITIHMILSAALDFQDNTIICRFCPQSFDLFEPPLSQYTHAISHSHLFLKHSNHPLTETQTQLSILKVLKQYTSITFRCMYCLILFPSSNHLTSHIQTHANCTVKFYCHCCQEIFPETITPAAHFQEHINTKTRCPFCPKKYTSS